MSEDYKTTIRTGEAASRISENRSEKNLAASSILLTLTFSLLIIWLYLSVPQSLSEAVTNIKQGAQLATDTYRVDEAAFARGRELFNREQYAAARDEFNRADPLERDARVRFFIAYSFYRQGWGRLYSDDELFKQGLATIEQAQNIDSALYIEDADLGLHTPAELKAELGAGLLRDLSDFNPCRVVRERK